ncbi:hypothetical protein [Kitasatospora purpeofusca]|uniref:Uncharacterized protein n=1 Tax=Kitasatospora purpeofusca TaxID=67352 RepID=A0ABZ1TZ47_9ACTN|nr:hypothetical protein [Kitasatospora purpeofusca]
MKSLVGTHELPGSVTLRVFADHHDTDRYGLEITDNGETHRYDGGHTAREVQAFLGMGT